jgi:hypothetical protein
VFSRSGHAATRNSTTVALHFAASSRSQRAAGRSAATPVPLAAFASLHCGSGEVNEDCPVSRPSSSRPLARFALQPDKIVHSYIRRKVPVSNWSFGRSLASATLRARPTVSGSFGAGASSSIASARLDKDKPKGYTAHCREKSCGSLHQP